MKISYTVLVWVLSFVPLCQTALGAPADPVSEPVPNVPTNYELQLRSERPESEQMLVEQKLRAEATKLENETATLRRELANLERESPQWRSIREWVAAGSAALGALSVLVLGAGLNWAQARKIWQDQEQEEESHQATLFRELGSNDAGVRAATYSVLLHRYEKLKRRRESLWSSFQQSRVEELRAAEKMILDALLTANKGEAEERLQEAMDSTNSKGGDTGGARRFTSIVEKHFGDALVRATGAAPRDPNEPGARPPPGDSPLRGCDLQRASFQNVFWRKVNISGLDLYKINLQRASLRDAVANGVILVSASLTGATFDNANLDGSDLRDAKFDKTKLRHAKLRYASLRGASFTAANLEHAHLENARMVPEGVQAPEPRGVDFTDAHLVGAHLNDADLTMSSFDRATLVGAHFDGANLSRATFRGADLTNASFHGADLTGAVLDGAVGADLTGAKGIP